MTVYATSKETGHTTTFEDVRTLRTTDSGTVRIHTSEFTVIIDPETHIIDVDCC